MKPGKRNVHEVTHWPLFVFSVMKKPLLICIFILASLSVFYSLSTGRKDERKAFEMFFCKMPEHVQVVAFGCDRDIFGRSTSVIAFQIQESNLRNLLGKAGYVVTGIETDPGTWRLENCNYLLRNLARCDFRVNPASECYSREMEMNRARVYYDKKQDLAILIGFASVLRPGK